MTVTPSPDQPQKLTKWAKEPNVRDLKEDLAMAKPSHDTMVLKIQEWINLRDVANGEAPKKQNNRSSVQPKLIRRQGEWRYAALTEPFLSAETLFNIKGTTWEDKKGAEQNNALLEYQMRTKVDRVRFIDEYVRTCHDEGAVVVRPGWRRETVIEKVETPVFSFYPVTDQAQAEAIQQAMALMQENPQGFEELPEELQESASYSMEIGQLAYAEQTGTEFVEEERIIRNHPTLDVLDFENVIIDPTCNGDLSKANFAIISFETSKAELIADGRYENLDRINWANHSTTANPEHSSNTPNDGQGFKDDLRKRVVAYEYWGFYDIEGKDRLTPIVATWIGETLIRLEENPYPDKAIPLVVVPYMPLKKKLNGETDAELLKDNQKIIGAVTRGMIDLLGRSANGQTGMSKGFLDTLNRRRYERGDNYEFNPQMPPEMGVYQHKYPEIPQSALTMLQLQNADAEAMSGTKAFSGGLSGNAYGDVAAGARAMLDAAAKREMSILRRLASGMEQIGRKLVSMNQAFLTDEEVVQVTNEQYITVSREDLAGEFNITVDVTTAEIEEAQAQDLGFMLQTMGNTLPWEITQKIFVEIARLKRMPTLAKMVDNYQPQPDLLAQKKQELELAELEAKIAKLQSETMENRANAQRLASEADKKDLEFIEQETGTTHARDLQKQQQQGESNMMNTIAKAITSPPDKRPSDEDIGDAVTLHQIAASQV